MNIHTSVNIDGGISAETVKWGTGNTGIDNQRLPAKGTEDILIKNNAKFQDVAVSDRTKDGKNIPVSLDDLQKTTEEVEKKINALNTKIAISIDKDTETPVVQFIDKESGEVIRQMPAEDILKLRANFNEMVRGLFFNKET